MEHGPLEIGFSPVSMHNCQLEHFQASSFPGSACPQAAQTDSTAICRKTCHALKFRARRWKFVENVFQFFSVQWFFGRFCGFCGSLIPEISFLQRIVDMSRSSETCLLFCWSCSAVAMQILGPVIFPDSLSQEQPQQPLKQLKRLWWKRTW